MRFYKIQGDVNKVRYLFKGDFDDAEDYLRDYAFHRKVRNATERANEGLRGSAFLSASRIDAASITVCLFVQDRIDLEIEDATDAYLADFGMQVKKLRVMETTFETFKDLLRHADREDFIEDDDDVLEDVGLGRLSNRRHYLSTLNYSESIFEPNASKDDARKCARLLTADDLKDEVARIKASGATKAAHGHPVHYLILSDDEETQEKTQAVLLNNLIKKKRITSKRVCETRCERSREISRAHTESLFSMCHEGAMSISLQQIQGLDGDRVDDSLENLEILCDCVKKHRNDVLTIFLLPKESTQLKNYLFENLGNLSFVKIDERPADPKRARQLLRTMAKDEGLVADKNLFAKLESSETYLTIELRMMFEEWFSKKLRTEVFPQYAQFKMVKTNETEKEAKGSAFADLMEMIGLADAKQIIGQAIDFHKMQRFLSNQDVTRERPAQHMVFTGNPGTAKTTVARLFARIMRDNELLSTGYIVEVGRADLVGKYVGHTAPLVKSAFKKAKGGVLFIDEAYALVDDRDGCFGDEAINTIVQEMENNRDNVIVIFAGYPDKMEQFMQKNPGLRSRIAFHVPFPDYSVDELGEIAELVASKKGMKLSDDAHEKLLAIFESAREEEDFGNGRYVRSAIEKAMMAQASRIVRSDMESLSKTELSMLIAEDIEMPKTTKSKRLKLGFCA